MIDVYHDLVKRPSIYGELKTISASIRHIDFSLQHILPNTKLNPPLYYDTSITFPLNQGVHDSAAN
jgi:hypothetical protein